ncbi:MAG TPA: nuclear transport factor 2 family protein [Alcanivorax sp.]|nr:nuclear transport factor 2 family protein [Alcanivorax sp.]
MNTLLYRCLTLGLAALASFAVASPKTEVLLEHYGDALQEQNAEALSSLFAPDAEVRLLLEQPGAEPLAITLTEDEHLQQLRALWRFSEEATYSLSDVTHSAGADVHRVQFTQTERYRLFGQTLHRDGRVRMRVRVTPGGLLITGIEALISER